MVRSRTLRRDEAAFVGADDGLELAAGAWRAASSRIADGKSNESPATSSRIYLWTYSCFVVLGLAFAFTAWRTRA